MSGERLIPGSYPAARYEVHHIRTPNTCWHRAIFRDALSGYRTSAHTFFSPNNLASSTSGPPKYSFAQIRAKAIEYLGYKPCLWQVKVVDAILKRDGDVVCIAATGSGKTLTFWLPLLFKTDGIQIVVSPLNILGQQNVAQLAAMKINITAETATAKNFQDIEDGKYSVVVTNVETLMQHDGGFEKLWKKPHFTSRVLSLVWDEGHCVSKWACFRPEYKEVGRLRNLIPRTIPFIIVSATLPREKITALSLSPAVAQAFTHTDIMKYIELIGLLKPITTTVDSKAAH
ncbi:P-loop containing nucleoside triphosphate hydrolase protein [Mycena rebaudengoi]|nr:P-loop containing nucleoside triphosphate hydrolase protein [Mycena rebaudengoi]